MLPIDKIALVHYYEMGPTNKVRDTLLNDFTKLYVHQLFDLNQRKEKCICIVNYIAIEYHIKEYDLTHTEKYIFKGSPLPIQNDKTPKYIQ